ncbi:BamA/TamA family outer membrane protein [Dapis sp. BLCC M172]|uniref:BamA/TamA family outer membrane protein n=1 Tax=Dapis sp. BLCC M172 TaxID=2975281 RepID=UPI003CEDE74E
MPKIFSSSLTIISALTLGLETILVNQLWTPAVLAQSSSENFWFFSSYLIQLEESYPETLVDFWQNSAWKISKYSFAKSLILDPPSTNAVDLLPNSQEQKITAQNNSEPEFENKEVVDPFSKSAGGQLNIKLTDSNSSRSFGLGTIISYPDALNGPTRQSLDVPQQETGLASISIAGRLRQNLGNNNSILLEGILDPKRYGLDLRYGNLAPFLPGAFAANIYNSSGRIPVYENGEEDVDLPNGDVPWVIRFGGGFQYVQPLSKKLDGALGINYQIVSVRDAAFTNNIETKDELGNSFTFSDDGQDTLLTIDAALLFDNTDNPNDPNRGSRLRFGSSQSIPIGDAQIGYNRLSASFSQFIPLNLFGFSEGPRTLLLNLQGGAFIGDVPSYQAFNLGGTQTIRGFEKGEVSTSRSFVKATAEYRFPITELRLLKQDVELGGTLFVDYGNDLATADGVSGNPAGVRDKFGDGLGYGLGLSAKSVIGRMRLEFGFNNEGSNHFHFTFGDRF